MTRIAGTGSTNRIFQGQRKDFIVMRRDTFEYTGQIDYVDENGTDCTYDFTDCIGAMAIKKKKTDTTAVRIVAVSFDVEEYTLYLDAEDMDMDAGKYYYDLQIYDANSKMITKLYGDFIVLQDVTSMYEPEEQNFYCNFISDISYIEGLKSSLGISLSENINFSLGTVNKSQQQLKTYSTYILQPRIKSSETVVMSTAAVYRFMTYWFKSENTLSTEVSRLINYVLETYNTFTVEYSYSIFEHS